MTTTAKTIRTITRTPAASRGTVVRLATAAVLASMAVTAAGGTAAAAPSAPLPTFTGYGNDSTDPTGSDKKSGGTTDSPLLSPKQVASTLGLGTLKEDWSSTKLDDNTNGLSPLSCVATYAPGMSSSYSATPEAVAQNVLVDSNNQGVSINQAVVTLASKSEVAAQMKATVKQFKQCAGTTITFQEEGASQIKMTNGDPELNDDKTVLSIMQHDTKGSQTCERAVAGYRNAIIDVMACGGASTHGQGVALANALAAKVSSQKA